MCCVAPTKAIKSKCFSTEEPRLTEWFLYFVFGIFGWERSHTANWDGNLIAPERTLPPWHVKSFRWKNCSQNQPKWKKVAIESKRGLRKPKIPFESEFKSGEGHKKPNLEWKRLWEANSRADSTWNGHKTSQIWNKERNKNVPEANWSANASQKALWMENVEQKSPQEELKGHGRHKKPFGNWMKNKFVSEDEKISLRVKYLPPGSQINSWFNPEDPKSYLEVKWRTEKASGRLNGALICHRKHTKVFRKWNWDRKSSRKLYQELIRPLKR